MPPLALISLAAICAPPGVAAPAIDCTSAITPILMASLDEAWDWAGPARLRANAAASGMTLIWLGTRLGTRNGLGRCTIFSPDVVFCSSRRGEACPSLCLLFADWEGISG